jgi:hypothetical protein
MGTSGQSHFGTWYKFVPLMLFGGSWSVISESDPECIGCTFWRLEYTPTFASQPKFHVRFLQSSLLHHSHSQYTARKKFTCLTMDHRWMYVLLPALAAVTFTRLLTTLLLGAISSSSSPP